MSQFEKFTESPRVLPRSFHFPMSRCKMFSCSKKTSKAGCNQCNDARPPWICLLSSVSINLTTATHLPLRLCDTQSACSTLPYFFPSAGRKPCLTNWNATGFSTETCILITKLTAIYININVEKGINRVEHFSIKSQPKCAFHQRRFWRPAFSPPQQAPAW